MITLIPAKLSWVTSVNSEKASWTLLLRPYIRLPNFLVTRNIIGRLNREKAVKVRLVVLTIINKEKLIKNRASTDMIRPNPMDILMALMSLVA